MKIFLTGLLILLLLAVSSSSALASRVEVKGIGTYTYEGGFFSSAEPTNEEKTKGLTMAKVSAWKNYVATLNQARQQAIAAHEKEATDNLESFIIDYVILDAAKDGQTRTVKVVARVAFNDEAVSQFVAKLTVGDGQQAATSQDSLFSFLFVARKVQSQRQFDARKTNVQQTESAVNEDDDGGVKEVLIQESGGSTLRKTDEVTYAVESSQNLNTAFGEVVTTSGIEYVDYADIITNCGGGPIEKLQNEFANSDDFTPQTRKAFIDAAQACEVKYLAYGTVDTGVSSLDPVTGSQRTSVSVRAQLLDISKKLPKKIASVGPKQYASLGVNQNEAGINALNLAARDLAKTLVDQLNAKGIR